MKLKLLLGTLLMSTVLNTGIVACASDKYEMARNEFVAISKIGDAHEQYVRYKTAVNKYSDIVDPPETVYDYYSDDEIYLMQRCVETEAHGCSFESKVCVANVIFNRIESESFGDSVNEVIIPGQFCYSKKKIDNETVEAIEYAFLFSDLTNGSIAFNSMKKTKTFNKWEYEMTDDKSGHHFFKERSSDNA